MEDKLRDEYDLKTLKVRKMGAKRQKFGNNLAYKTEVVRLNKN